jgi:RNA polymerase sigma factor for flagellar operon FliA
MNRIATQRAEGDRRGRATSGRTSRRAIVDEHVGLVYHIARQLCRSKGIEVELDELVSAGTLGLIDAVEHFDASRGHAFSTFAAPRIRGAMLDELRRQDRVPRSVRRRAREVQAATEALTRALGRAPEHTELARSLGIDVETLWRWQADLERGHHVPLDAGRGSGSGRGGRDGTEAGRVQRIPDELLADDTPDAIDAIVSREDMETVRDAVLALAEQERTVLSLYYFEELKLSEIARVLGVSESRVSQIRSKAIVRLRATLGVAEMAIA